LFITNKELPFLYDFYIKYDTYIKEQLQEKGISGLVLEVQYFVFFLLYCLLFIKITFFKNIIKNIYILN